VLRRSPCSLATVALFALAHCGPRAARPDAGQRDASEDVLQVIEERPRPDRDGDGLCDDTETDVTRTDPDDVDTDGDGFIDGWEYSYGFSPLSSTAPSPDRLLQWSERPGEPFEQVFSLSFRGNGEGVLGTFWESPAGYDGLRAEELGLRIEALAAVPPSNAPDLLEDRFVSVIGTTRLSFRITGEWPQRAPLRCKRPYSLSPSAYADGRGLIYLRTFFLVVSASDVEPSLDASAPDANDTDSSMPDAGSSGPWPFQRDGLCLPRPTWPCR
jgi:hypothetical protein